MPTRPIWPFAAVALFRRADGTWGRRRSLRTVLLFEKSGDARLLPVEEIADLDEPGVLAGRGRDHVAACQQFETSGREPESGKAPIGRGDRVGGLGQDGLLLA